jgi:hypothetical protein
MDRCVRRYRELDFGDEPELLSYLAGRIGARWAERGFGTQGYFVRTWPLWAMLYAWDESAAATVIDALAEGDREATGRRRPAGQGGCRARSH